MSQDSLPPQMSQTWLEKLTQKARVPIVLVTLGFILYYTLFLALFVPAPGFEFQWRPDNVMRVYSVYEDSPIAQALQPDDIILKIDAQPVRWTLWRPLYAPAKEVFEFTVQRGDLTFVVTAAVDSNTAVVGKRAISGLVALTAWFIGALTILFATPQNRDAWRLGLTTLLVAVVIAAAEAALYNVPGSWLGSSPLIPIVAVAWIQVALLPRQNPPSARERLLFTFLYTAAIITGLFALFELVVLNPNNSSIESLTGISSYETLLLWLGIGLLVHLALLSWRFVRFPDAHQRQQIGIILVFSALAFLPVVFLTFLPRVIFDWTILPWEIAILLLVLSPIGYAYIIYRNNYLGLDVFMTQTLASLLSTLLLLSVYSILVYLFQRYFSPKIINPLPGSLLLFPLLLGVPYANKKMQRVTDRIVYGAEKQYQSSLARIASDLAVDPQVDTLKQSFHEICILLQVRQAILMLVDNNGSLVPVEWLRTEKNPQPLCISELEPILEQPKTEARTKRTIFTRYPWLHYSAPLATREKVVGVFLLGPPLPNSYFNAKQSAFLHQAANTMAVAVEAIQLFESSLVMSRTMLAIRDRERVFLASQIHDEPLQRLGLLASRLSHLAQQNGSVGDLTGELEKHSRALKTINRQLRDICAGLYPPVLQQGPQWAVQEVAATFREQTNLRIDLQVGLADDLMASEHLTTVVYHMLTEALNNIHKHARATAVSIILDDTGAGDKLLLSITDDGQETPPILLPLADLIRAHNFGIVGMHELARQVQGTLTIERRKDGGTVVLFAAPLNS